MIKNCCFTGHREIGEEVYIPLFRRLLDQITQLVENGCTVFCAGGALGFDTMAAQAVLRVKQKHKKIQLHLYLPCPQQADRWSGENRAVYQSIKNQADKVVYSSDKYTPYCMHQRNRALVDNADVCIAYCEKATGGTAYTLNYALSKGVDFINLADLI